MDRLALDFGETIESLRNEVESMWNEIETSFEKIDSEIGQTISRYEPTNTYFSKRHSSSLIPFGVEAHILYESDDNEYNSDTAAAIATKQSERYSNNTNQHLMPVQLHNITSLTSSISSASDASPHTDRHTRTLSPIQQQFIQNMQPSPAPPTYTQQRVSGRVSAYSTPVHAHVMGNMDDNDLFSRPRYLSYDSNTSDLFIDNDTIDIDIHRRISETHQLLAELNDFNRNDIAGVDIGIGIDRSDNNDTPNMPVLNSKQSFRIELDNPNDSPKAHRQTELNHMDDIDIDIGSNSSNGDMPDTDTERMALINRISDDLANHAYQFQHRNSHHKRRNTLRKKGMTEETQINNDLDTTKINHNAEDSDDNSGHSSMAYLFKDSDNVSDSENSPFDQDGLAELQKIVKRNSKPRLSVPEGLSNINVKVLQHSSSDEEEMSEKEDTDTYPTTLPAIPQTSSVNHTCDATQTPQDASNKHEKKKSISQLALQDLQLDRKVNMSNKRNANTVSNSVKRTPLTPLAMMTQIGTGMEDLSISYSQSVPSPPTMNGGTMARKSAEGKEMEMLLNSTQITPGYVNSDDYINIFEESVTDINYANNHALQSGINRADSDYKPLVQRDIETMVRKTTMVSPEAKSMHNLQLQNNLSYDFGVFSKSPVINEESGLFETDFEYVFERIEETIFIIKKNGEQFINEICDKLANENEFYINEFKEIYSEEYQSIDAFIHKHTQTLQFKSVVSVLRDLVSKDSFCVVPMYRINAISFLEKCVNKYQKGMALSNDTKNVRESVNNFVNANHLKKPTNELGDIDNEYFDDYNEYPSDDERRPMLLRDGNTIWFSSANVYAPKNINEYSILKQVLYSDTVYCDYNTQQMFDNNRNIKCMKSMAIIKPNAVLNEYVSLIRATLIGNGFVISECKAIKYNRTQIMDIYEKTHGFGMDSYTFYRNRNVNRNEICDYLCSGVSVVMIIKKYECLNVDECLQRLAALIGNIDPQMERSNDENTQSIRGCFGENMIKNAIDVTLTTQNFEKNAQLFF